MVHEVSNYDYEERIKAMWEKYQVQFTVEEYNRFKGTMNDLEVIYENEDRDIGSFVVVEWKPKKSEWEDLFK